MTRGQTAGKRKRLRIILGVLLAAILLVCAGFAIYVGDYYHADETAVQAMAPADGIATSKTDGGDLVFAPPDSKAGLIFYPGGKVEYTAYAPLMRACAEKGILCVLVKMPCNLAVLDANAADGIAEQYPDIDAWYIGGHSLGGHGSSLCGGSQRGAGWADPAGGLLHRGSERFRPGGALGVRLRGSGAEPGKVRRIPGKPPIRGG